MRLTGAVASFGRSELPFFLYLQPYPKLSVYLFFAAFTTRWGDSTFYSYVFVWVAGRHIFTVSGVVRYGVKCWWRAA